MQLVLHSRGLALRVRAGAFMVKLEDIERRISVEEVNSIAVTGGITLSSGAVRLAAKAGIPIYFFDAAGRADACLRSPYFESLALLRRKQVYFSDDIAGAVWVLEQFKLKTDGQLKNLKLVADRVRASRSVLSSAIAELSESNDVPDPSLLISPSPEWSARVMGHEGYLARVYWSTLGAALPRGWGFERRSRRPARDPFNALLNYFYGILYARTEQALFAAGLDPHLGILHADEYDRPTLAYDLIEAFRPWVDRFLLEKILRHQLPSEVTQKKEQGYWIGNEAKRELIPSFNEYMEKRVRWRGRQMTRTAQMYRHAAELARHIEESTKRPNA